MLVMVLRKSSGVGGILESMLGMVLRISSGGRRGCSINHANHGAQNFFWIWWRIRNHVRHGTPNFFWREGCSINHASHGAQKFIWSGW